MISRVSLFVTIISLISRLVSSACQPKPVFLPIEDVELSNEGSMRGVSVAVGSPSKNISLLVNAAKNETYIYGRDGHCDNVFSDPGCFMYRGGQWDPAKSSTASRIRNRKTSDSISAHWYQDNLYAQLNVSLNNVYIGIPNDDLDQEYGSQAQLGVGRHSSMLHTLKEAGRIGARAYSIFWGLASGPTDQRTPGSLALGGFDEGVTGAGAKNFTSSMTYGSGCATGMLVAINDISLNWPNGTDSSIFMGSRSELMQACLQPDYPGLMTLPFKYWENFMRLAGGRYPGDQESRALGMNFWTMLFEPEGVYYGDMTISIQNSISIRIPNTQLVVEERFIEPATGEIITNDTVRNIVINPIQDVNENDLPILGRLFFTSAYLSVNHDTETFSLWQAITSSEKPIPRALDSNNAIISESCSENETEGQIPRPTATTPDDPTEEEAPKKGLSSAVIGGMVAGIIAGVAILGAGVLFLVRKRRHACRHAEPEVPNQDYQPPPLYYKDSDVTGFPLETSEMQATKYPCELDGSGARHEVQELDGREYRR